MLTPQTTYLALLIVQALHLLHHRLTKRHISFVEVISAMVLCVPWWIPIPELLMMGTHIALIVVQVIGSVWIQKLSPDWNSRKLAKLGEIEMRTKSSLGLVAMLFLFGMLGNSQAQVKQVEMHIDGYLCGN